MDENVLLEATIRETEIRVALLKHALDRLDRLEAQLKFIRSDGLLAADEPAYLPKPQ